MNNKVEREREGIKLTWLINQNDDEQSKQKQTTNSSDTQTQITSTIHTNYITSVNNNRYTIYLSIEKKEDKMTS